MHWMECALDGVAAVCTGCTGWSVHLLVWLQCALVVMECALDGVAAVCTGCTGWSVHWLVWLQCALDILDGVAAVCTGCDGVCTGWSVHCALVVLDGVCNGWLVHWLDFEQGFCFSYHSKVFKYLFSHYVAKCSWFIVHCFHLWYNFTSSPVYICYWNWVTNTSISSFIMDIQNGSSSSSGVVLT